MIRRALGAIGILLILLLVGGSIFVLGLAFSPALTPTLTLTPSEKVVTHTPVETQDIPANPGRDIQPDAPTETSTPETTPTPPPPEEATVQPGETLGEIAARYGMAPAGLRAANWMYGDALVPGQMISLARASAPLPAPEAGFPLEGDLAAAYPLSLSMPRFRLHYAPQTFPAVDPAALALLAQRGLENLESIYPDALSGSFDLYAAGSLFAPPDQALRGRSFSDRRQNFILHDGTGNYADQQYIFGHEITHLFLWNVYGPPGNALVSEGAAVDAGMLLAEPLGHLPLEQFCAAYLQAGALPALSGLSFEGHIYDLPNYYAAGCFVRYLRQTYGAAAFGSIYSSLDFPAAYGGKGLAALEAEWRAALALVELPPGLDPAALVAGVETLRSDYRALFASFDPLNPAHWEDYRLLDARRIAILSAYR